MVKWILPFFLLLGASSLLLYRDFFRRDPAQVSPVSEGQKGELRDNIECALNEIDKIDRFYNNYSKSRSILTLNLIYERLAEGFAYHGITSPVEKSHFLAQVFHETGNLIHTIEKYNDVRWNRVIRNTDPSSSWNCDAYYDTAREEKTFSTTSTYTPKIHTKRRTGEEGSSMSPIVTTI